MYKMEQSRIYLATLGLLLVFITHCDPSQAVSHKDRDEPPSTVRRDLGRKLIVTTKLEKPYMMFKEKDTLFMTGNDRFEGYMADILSHLSESLGFRYEIRLVHDGKYGGMGENGTWLGMIGEIHRGMADLAVGPLIITPARQTVVDFTRPYMTLRSTAVLRRHKRRRLRIRTAEDLTQSNLHYGLLENGITMDFFRATDNATYSRMYAEMTGFWPSAFVHSIQEGVGKARREKYAFILDAPLAEYIANRQPCDLYTLEPFLDIKQYAFGLKKGDRLKEVLDKELLRMQLNQDMQNLYLKWWRGECNEVEFTKNPVRHARTERQADWAATTMPSPWREATAPGYNKYLRGGQNSITAQLRTIYALGTVASLVILLTV